MKIARKPLYLLAWLLILSLPLTASSGCILSHLIYVIRGHKVKAPFGGLAEKRVAVVCLTESDAFGHDTLTQSVCKTVSLKLQGGVKKIQVVQPGTIADWLDKNDWNQVDFVKLGQGVKAQRVVAIKIDGYRIHEGSTLYKGRSNVTVTVYDVENSGNVLFEAGPEEYIFPKSGRPAIQTNDRNFEAMYLAKLTQHIANYFCDHDPLENVADDASMMGF